MITVKLIPNILKKERREEKTLPYSRQKFVKDYIKEVGFSTKDLKVIVSGKKITNLNCVLDNGDEIIITPEVKFVAIGSAMIASGATLSAATMTALTILDVILALASVGYSIYSAIMGRRKPSFNTVGKGIDESSPTYGWDGIRTVQEIGIPVPVLYGQHKIGGNVLNAYIRTDGNKNYLNVLLGLCEGEIHSIDTIKVNDNPAENFDGITTDKRYGINSPSLITNFEDAHNMYDVNVTLTKDNAHVYTTIDSDVEAFEIHLQLPGGLFKQDAATGTVQSWGVTYKVEYKLHADPGYTDLGSTTITDKTRSTIRRVYRKDDLTAGQYDIRVTRTSDDSQLDPLKQGDLQWTQLDEIKTDDFLYPNTALLGIEALATEQLSGAMPNFTCIAKGKMVSVPKILYPNVIGNPIFADWTGSAPDDYTSVGAGITLAKESTIKRTGDYSLKITRAGTDGGVTQTNGDEVTWGNMVVGNWYEASAWVRNDGSACFAKLGVLNGATEESAQTLASTTWTQLSMRFRAESTTVKIRLYAYHTNGSVYFDDVQLLGEIEYDEYYWDDTNSKFKMESDDTELDWDEVTYHDKYSANPVWCVRDLLLNSRYGLGEFVDSTHLSVSLMLEMSKYCDGLNPDGLGGYEKRFRMDVMIDSPAKAPDVITQLCAVFRGLPFYSQGIINFKIDKPDDPVQLFTMGNIIENSFSQSWKSIRDIPNVVEVQFLDKDKDYKQDTIAYSDEAALAAGDPMRKEQVRVFLTSLSRAIKEGRYAAKVAKYINRSIGFRAGIDSIACQASDVIAFAHDVPQWGYSGRVQSGSSVSKVMVDQGLVIADGKSYAIMVQFADDTIEERVVTNTPGTETGITVSSVFSQIPGAYDKYSFGETDKVKKNFRIISINKDSSNEASISAIELDDDVYDDSEISIPDNNYSSLVLTVPNVRNLTLTERLVKRADGTIDNAIDVWFDKPELYSGYVKRYQKAKIYLSENDTDWGYRGETFGSEFSIIGDVIGGVTYYVKVVTVADTGEDGSLSDSPSSSIELLGKAAPPSDVSSFLANQSRDRLVMGWTEIDDVDVWGYEIRWGTSWGSGQIMAFKQGNKHVTMDFRTGSGQSYWIKAIDTSGNYSETATESTITVDNIPFRNIVTEYSEQTAWTGSKTNTDTSGDNLIISAGDLSGTYETPVRDVGYIATFLVAIEVITAITQGRAFNDDSTTKFNSSLTERFTGAETPGAATFEIKTSEDNIAWSDYAAYQVGDYKCRYFQIRMTLTRENVGDSLLCSTFDYYSDLPDIDEIQDGEVTVAADGDDIVFEKTYHESPAMNIVILTGDGVYGKTTGLDTTGVNIKLYDESGVLKTGTFRVHIHGI